MAAFRPLTKVAFEREPTLFNSLPERVLRPYQIDQVAQPTTSPVAEGKASRYVQAEDLVGRPVLQKPIGVAAGDERLRELGGWV